MTTTTILTPAPYLTTRLKSAAGGFDEIMVVSPSAVMQLLLPGDHRLTAEVGSKCGLVPIAGACQSITTAGLEWDMDGACMVFGGLVSTSNIVAQPEVRVRTSDPVLWTMNLSEEDSSDGGGGSGGGGGGGGGGEASMR